MSRAVPLNAVIADDLLLDAVAHRRPVVGDELVELLQAYAAYVDTGEPSAKSVRRRRRMTLVTTGLAAFALAMSGAGVAAAFDDGGSVARARRSVFEHPRDAVRLINDEPPSGSDDGDVPPGPASGQQAVSLPRLSSTGRVADSELHHELPFEPPAVRSMPATRISAPSPAAPQALAATTAPVNGGGPTTYVVVPPAVRPGPTLMTKGPSSPPSLVLGEQHQDRVPVSTGDGKEAKPTSTKGRQGTTQSVPGKKSDTTTSPSGQVTTTVPDGVGHPTKPVPLDGPGADDGSGQPGGLLPPTKGNGVTQGPSGPLTGGDDPVDPWSDMGSPDGWLSPPTVLNPPMPTPPVPTPSVPGTAISGDEGQEPSSGTVVSQPTAPSGAHTTPSVSTAQSQ